jgi:hypothetical protein
MSFIGTSWVKQEEVNGEYRKFNIYDMSDDENADIKHNDVVLHDDVCKRINQIEDDIKSIIRTIEKYDLPNALDDLKILAEKLY